MFEYPANSGLPKGGRLAPLSTPEPGLPADPPPDPLTPPAVELGLVVRAVRHRPWTVVVVALVAVVAALWIARNRTPQYAASAVVRLSDTRRAIVGGLGDPVARNESPTTDPILSELEILRSRAVARRVVARPDGAILRVRTQGLSVGALADVALDSALSTAAIDLQFDPERVIAAGGADRVAAPYGTPLTIAGVRFSIEEPPAESRGRLYVLSREAAALALAAGTRARKREGTDVVDVTLTANDPHIAQYGANLLVAEYQRVNLDAVQQRSRRRRQFIEEQLAHTLVLAEGARDSLTDFRSRRRARAVREPFSREQGEGEVSLLIAQRDQLLADRRRHEQVLGGLEAAGGEPTDVRLGLVGVADPNPVVAELAGQLARLGATRDSLTTGPWSYAPTHPDIVRLDTLIVLARGRLATAVRGHAGSLGARAAEVSRVIDRGTNRLGELPSADAEEHRLAERQDLYEQMMRQLRDEYQRAQIAAAVEAGDVELVDEAMLPFQRSDMADWRIVTLGLLLGLGGGVTAAFGLEQTNRKMRRREDLERLLGVPSLAIIPMVRRHGRARLTRMLSRSNGQPDHGSRLVRMGSTLADRLPEEAFRTLRTNVLFADASHAMRTIAVTSARVGEGKTTVCVNLAVSLARQGLRVLLVDCDFRRPRLHSSFNLPQGPGLSDVIAGVVSAAAAVRPTAHANVQLLSAGTRTSETVELLGVMPMQDVLVTLAREFDLIIADTPPTLAATDASVVSAISDGVIFVVRAGRTSQAEGRRALQQLHRVGAHVLGAVLNDRDESSRSDSYYADTASYMEDGAAR